MLLTAAAFFASALLSDVRIWQVSDRQVVVDYRIGEAPVDVEVSFFTNGVEVSDARCWDDDSARRSISVPGKYRTVWYADKFADDSATWDVAASAKVRVRKEGHVASVTNVGPIELGGKGIFKGGVPAPGYRGVWYGNEPSRDEYAFKYSGGLGTYCEGHVPMAVHSRAAGRTFFCWGGTTGASSTSLVHMVASFDHRTRRLSTPVVVLDKRTTDAHDNPVISLDDDGYVWMFSSSHGRLRRSYISRSVRPHDISRFSLVKETNFSYPQPHFIPGKGFLFLHTWYSGGRHVGYSLMGKDGSVIAPRRPLVFIDKGNYLRSWRHGNRVGVVFDRHPVTSGTQPLNRRTDLYYMETADFGRTWRNASGDEVSTPVTEPLNPALVRRYSLDGDAWRNVYIKGVRFTPQGRPVILYLLSRGYRSGPESGPREWWTAAWNGASWDIRDTTVRSDSNYDFGFLDLRSESDWRMISATGRGPQAFNPGGEIEAWRSVDGGATWSKERDVTSGSLRNHSYPRQVVDAHPDFLAFWADGDGRKISESHLHYCDEDLNVYDMPY